VVVHEGTEQPGAGLPRRLLGLAVSAAWILGSLTIGYLLWPSSLGGCTTLTIVSGESMEPTYYTGDLVVSRCGPVEVGDVIVYNPPNVGGARVIHRIVDGNAEDGWVVQGDNNGFLDPWEPTDDQILGSARLHIPQVGRFAAILLSPLTWISLMIVALAIVVWPSKEPEDGAEPGPDANLESDPENGPVDEPVQDSLGTPTWTPDEEEALR
jgi:signal peptidase